MSFKISDNLMSEKEAAARLGVSRFTLLRLRAENKISFFQIKSCIRFSEKQVQDFLASAENKVGANREAA